MFQKLCDSLLTLVYPLACRVCQKSVEQSSFGVVCQSCWDKTRIYNGNETICHKCGRFLIEKPSQVKTFCHQCADHFYEQARSVGRYERGLSASVLHLKKEPFISDYLRSLLIETFWKSSFPDPDLIIPVPLSKRKLFERGYNQAAVPAKVLSRETGIKLDKQSLIRIKHNTVHRAGMDKKGREISVFNAFRVKRGKLIGNKKILLIDDVLTSGATVSMCAKALKERGADKIYVLTIARTN